MNLTGIGFANYRSIGQQPVWLDLTKKVNILIGANNAGKSNVFRALQFVRDKKGTGTFGRLDEIDRHRRDGSQNLTIYLRAVVTADDKSLSLYFKEILLGIEHSLDKESVIHNPFSDMGFSEFAKVTQEYVGSSYNRQLSGEELKQNKDLVARRVVEGFLLPQVPAVFIFQTSAKSTPATNIITMAEASSKPWRRGRFLNSVRSLWRPDSKN